MSRTPLGERLRAIREADHEQRQPRPTDMHVMPTYGREHESSALCWCWPALDSECDGSDGAGRVWVHCEDN